MARCVKSLLEEAALALAQPDLCLPEMLKSVKKELRAAIAQEASEEDVDVAQITALFEMSQDAATLQIRIKEAQEEAEAAEAKLLHMQHAVAKIATQSPLSVASVGALLSLLSRMIPIAETLQMQRNEACQIALVDCVCPSVARLQLIVGAMGKDMARMPPRRLLSQVAIGNVELDAPAQIRAWIGDRLNALETQSADIARTLRTNAEYANLLEYAVLIIADLQHQHFACTCSRSLVAKSHKGAQ